MSPKTKAEGGFSRRKTILGINGLGRIGKLTLWNQIGRRFFSAIVVNIGREAGTRLEDVADYIEKDSTYGSLHNYLYGHKSQRLISDIDEKKGIIKIDGIPVTILKESRNPANINWGAHDVSIVVDATGKFLDPTIPADSKSGSLRGHLRDGVQRVIASAPYKIKDKSASWPEDSVTVVMGINEDDYQPAKHKFISSASCTTTCLAHMLKPLLAHFGSDKILGVTMSTIHAVTSSQEILDRLPKAGAVDLRKTRSVMNNIILTSTGVLKTLALVMPEMKDIGFIAESIRIPVNTGSLIVLIVTLQGDKPLTKEMVNDIYKKAALKDKNGYLSYTDKQNVSSDIVGLTGPAAIIEGHDTYTLNANIKPGVNKLKRKADEIIGISVSQAVIHGWYDNELGSFTNMLGNLIIKAAS